METDDQPIQRKKRAKKPNLYLEGRLRQINIYLPIEMIEWLRGQSGGSSRVVRNLIKTEMEKEKERA